MTQDWPFTKTEMEAFGKLFVWWIMRVDWTKAIGKALPLKRKR